MRTDLESRINYIERMLESTNIDDQDLEDIIEEVHDLAHYSFVLGMKEGKQ